MSDNQINEVISNQDNSNDILLLKISYICVLFFPLLTLILALVKNSAYKNDSVLSSHLRWQLSTLLKAIVYSIVILIITFILVFFMPFIMTFLCIILYGCIALWVVYRVIKGFIKLSNRQVI